MPKVTLRRSPVRRRVTHKKEEHNSQAMLITWLSRQYPAIKKVTAKFCNDGIRTPAQAMWMKAEGLLPGMPDIGIFWPTVKHPALFIEMKSTKGTTSAAQREVIANLRAAGNKCVVCRSFDEAKMAVEAYLVDEPWSVAQDRLRLT